jgi:hypothetical protein
MTNQAVSAGVEAGTGVKGGSLLNRLLGLFASAVNEYARTLTRIGDSTGARRWQERVLASIRRDLGDEDPRTLTEMSNLASILQDESDLAGARDLMEQVLAISQLNYGDKHPNTLTAMNNLASAVRAQGDLAGAQALQERVLAASRQMLGDEHPNTLAAMNNLAITLNERAIFPLLAHSWRRRSL